MPKGLMAAIGIWIGLAALQAAPAPPSTDPVFKHGLELRVRHVGEAEFSDQTKKIGVEFYLDGDGGNGLYIDETGAVAAVPAKFVAPEDAKAREPDWSHAMELAARQSGEKEFTKETHKYGIEVFVDANNGNYLYIGETGALAVVPAKLGAAKMGKEVKPPQWQNALELRVRKAGEPDFNDKTKKIGVEVYQDANNGNIVYLSETGSVAVLPASLAKMDPSKREPDWLYGMEMDVRKAGEAAFTKDTKRYGAEVYRDAFTGAVLYIDETGALAVTAASLSGTPDSGAKVKGMDSKRAMELGCRKAGEASFNQATRRFGVEVYFDPNTGNTVYLSETGALSVVAAKE